MVERIRIHQPFVVKGENKVSRAGLTVRGDERFGDSRAVWRARLFLFQIGFTFMAGGLAGSVTVLVLKYILHDHPEKFNYYGYANVSQDVALILSAVVVLWVAHNTSSEYEYNLTL